MSAATVTFVQVDGVEKTIEGVVPGESLMEVGRNNGVEGILGDCGGSCACATCHVYVDPDWHDRVGTPDEVESATLDMVADVQKPTSRLSCQIKFREELSGLKLVVAPSV